MTRDLRPRPDAQPATSAPWRPTRQRTAVLNALHGRTGFTSAQELHEALEADGVTIGLTTVYRTLHALDRSGRVDVVRDRTGERLYRHRPTDGHRHYIVCRDCGLSAAVEAEAVERWADEVAETMGFAEVEHTVELSGVCGPCRTEHRRAAAEPPPPRGDRGARRANS
ncbi:MULTISPECIES: Fur family transcriptional regulator [Streptomyces rochei group]|uniref:Fur family transcriptional regulator n=1 Tax=Streptomyces rochei group TaxID=2867164 RepID=UPI0018764B2C|nr:Fur family transcriptional regulator [Streptomyces vinaceusdrappus]GHB94953.1 putative ferric uptake regulator FurB [Streptomyces vinaceusdrappus]